jgi:fatty-acyl-CoA synthase
MADGPQLKPTTVSAAPEVTVGHQVLARAGDARTGIRFEDETWTWAQATDESLRRAAWLLEQRRPGPFHVGVLLDNVPEYVFLLGAVGLAGGVVVALNSTRTGPELARDLEHTDCQLVITESAHVAKLEGLTETPVFDSDSDAYRDTIAATPIPDASTWPAVDPHDLFILIFTSGTSGAPKAVMNSHTKMTAPGISLGNQLGLSSDDVLYVTMPLFHSNALLIGWGNGLANAATIALRRRFSASQFLPDVRKYGVTFFNYVGKPLSYVLAQPEHPDDADNPLRMVLGNEATERDLERFKVRFGCMAIDGFSSTEGGVVVQRTADTPPGSIGKPAPGTAVVNAETLEECPPARFDVRGRLLNADDAVGEFVNKTGAGAFQGYYNNPEADSERMRNGWYWSGDLGYRDEAGFYYFAGRTMDWLRVDGENLAVAPIEGVLYRHPDVVIAAAYAVPSPVVGDDVMATLLLRDGVTFDPTAFAAFLGEQRDLNDKAVPRFVRVARDLPETATNKVLKRELAAQRWVSADEIWWRPGKETAFQALDDAAVDAIAQEFKEHGREDVLDGKHA